MKNWVRLLFCFYLLMIFHLGNGITYAGYFQQDESKGIQSEEYVKKRPVASKAYSGPQTATAKKRYYRPKNKKNIPVPPKMERATLGFTMWRYQQASAEDISKGVAEVDPRSGKQQKAERMETETPLAVGEQIRIGIEPLSHDGYLYIINREKYADGSYGEPMLVFPTLNSRSNFVKAGVLTTIPAEPNVFQITRNSEKKQVAEELIIIVSPKMLVGPELLEPRQISIAAEQISKWEKQWKTDAFQSELIGGVGEIMTVAERTAGKDQSKGVKEVTPTLTRDDAPPQTVFQMNIRRGNPIMTTVTLPIKPN